MQFKKRERQRLRLLRSECAQKMGIFQDVQRGEKKEEENRPNGASH